MALEDLVERFEDSGRDHVRRVRRADRRTGTRPDNVASIGISHELADGVGHRGSVAIFFGTGDG